MACSIGSFDVTATGERRRVEGQTTSRDRQTGTATIYRVTGPDDVSLELADVRWSNGERDVRTLDRGESPQRFDRLCSGLRLTVQGMDDGSLVSELSQARLKPNGWSNLYSADRDELDDGARVDVVETLRRLGAVGVGPREMLLRDWSNRRNRWCVRFMPDAQLVPVGAYVVTRVAPIHYRLVA